MLNGVDSAYVLSRRARVDFGAAERLVSTEREVSDMRAARASSAAVAAGETEFKPICELFFMAMRALSLGYARTWNKYTSLVSDLSRMAEASRASPEGEKQFAEMLAIKCCCDVHLLEPSLVHRTLTMLECAACWMYRIAAPNGCAARCALFVCADGVCACTRARPASSPSTRVLHTLSFRSRSSR